MAVVAYSRWEAQGRPVEPCTPVRDIVARMKAKYPNAGPFSWYANEAHYQAVPAEDHTPFSQTGWPGPSPQWVVFATDIMHQPTKGVDCAKLFAYWIAEARAGRMPWLKYMIWQAKIYDVRNQWRGNPSAGHYDHIHLSVRTDHRFTSLGSWSLFPGTTPVPEVPDMDKLQATQLANCERYLQALTALAPVAEDVSDTVNLHDVPFKPTETFARILVQLTDIQTHLRELSSPTLPEVDLEAVRAIVREELNQMKLISNSPS